MKKFIFRVFLPAAAIILIVLGALECFIRSLPNDYKIQRENVESQADSIKVLVLGSSATSRGVIPRFLDIQPAYNCAYSGRSMNYDYYILKKYIDRMDSLKYVIVDMNYSKLWWEIEPNSNAAGNIKYYSIYWGIPLYKGFDYQYELSTCFTDIKGLKYKFKKSRLEYDGYQAGGQMVFDEQKWKSRAIERIKQFVIEDETHMNKVFEDNQKYLKEMIKLCQDRRVQVLMIWIPVDKTMSDLFDADRMQIIDEKMNELQNEYSNFRYYDMSNDTTFNHDDMMNVDHLNRQGATKLTKRINDYIKDIEKN